MQIIFTKFYISEDVLPPRKIFSFACNLLTFLASSVFIFHGSKDL